MQSWEIHARGGVTAIFPRVGNGQVSGTTRQSPEAEEADVLMRREECARTGHRAGQAAQGTREPPDAREQVQAAQHCVVSSTFSSANYTGTSWQIFSPPTKMTSPLTLAILVCMGCWGLQCVAGLASQAVATRRCNLRPGEFMSMGTQGKGAQNTLASPKFACVSPFVFGNLCFQCVACCACCIIIMVILASSK